MTYGDLKWRDPRTLFAGMTNVHSMKMCVGEHCVVHYPSEHHMRSWPVIWRSDRRAVERYCKHAIGHPDPDDAAYWRRVGQPAKTIHGCCGCCHDNTKESNANRTAGTVDDHLRDREDRGVDSVVVVAGTCPGCARCGDRTLASACRPGLRSVGRA